MPNQSRASRLWVVSDLHLAPPGEQCVFNAHAALVALIDHLAALPASDPPQWVVLNGDVFDYLQIPDYDQLSLPIAAQRTARILDALEAEPPERNVVRALRRLTAKGHRLSCMPGNHDPELNLSTVQQLLAERLGCVTELAPWAGEWRLQIGACEVAGRHGHYGDAFNAISSTQMLAAQSAGDASMPLPPGSRLVLNVINPFRRAKTPDGRRRFPFVDALPSEQAVVLAIMLLDPALAAKRLPDALGIGAAALIRKALMAGGLLGQRLSFDERRVSTVSSQYSWLDNLTGALAEAASHQGTDATVIDYELDAYFSGGSPRRSDARLSLSFGAGGVRGLLLRALARTLDDVRTAFRSGVTDALANDSMSTWGKGRIALAGHTHAARCLALDDRASIYINTGSWIDQVIPPAGLVGDGMSDWLELLQHGEVPLWNGYPVAVVDGDGPRLMRWDGQNLQSWQDPA